MGLFAKMLLRLYRRAAFRGADSVNAHSSSLGVVEEQLLLLLLSRLTRPGPAARR
jgi:hypothetical protein